MIKRVDAASVSQLLEIEKCLYGKEMEGSFSDRIQNLMELNSNLYLQTDSIESILLEVGLEFIPLFLRWNNCQKLRLCFMEIKRRV
jgi:hypothetical protein